MRALGFDYRAAEPPGAGKTTLLTALLPFTRDDTMAYFTRGWGETFDLPPPSDDYPTYILVNEISDHLPVYSWGPYVVRIFGLLEEGYSLCSTVHADTVEGVIEQMRDEVGVAPEHLDNLTFVAPMAMETREGETLRRVRDVGLIGDGGKSVERIATWDSKRDAFSVLDDESARAALADRLGLDELTLVAELDRREAFLQRLLDDGVSDIPAVQEAVTAFTSS